MDDVPEPTTQRDLALLGPNAPSIISTGFILSGALLTVGSLLPFQALSVTVGSATWIANSQTQTSSATGGFDSFHAPFYSGVSDGVVFCVLAALAVGVGITAILRPTRYRQLQRARGLIALLSLLIVITSWSQVHSGTFTVSPTVYSLGRGIGDYLLLAGAIAAMVFALLGGTRRPASTSSVGSS